MALTLSGGLWEEVCALSTFFFSPSLVIDLCFPELRCLPSLWFQEIKQPVPSPPQHKSKQVKVPCVGLNHACTRAHGICRPRCAPRQVCVHRLVPVLTSLQAHRKCSCPKPVGLAASPFPTQGLSTRLGRFLHVGVHHVHGLVHPQAPICENADPCAPACHRDNHDS